MTRPDVAGATGVPAVTGPVPAATCSLGLRCSRRGMNGWASVSGRHELTHTGWGPASLCQ